MLFFGGIIKENILYGKLDVSLEEVEEVVKMVNVWEFINGFLEGLEIIVGERGVKLLGG